MPLSSTARMAARVTLLAAAAAFSGLNDPMHANAAAAGRGGRAAPLSSSSSSSSPSRPAVCAASAADDPSSAAPAQASPRWSVRRTVGDGACLFRAVVQGASLADRGLELSPDDEERQARSLRHQVVLALKDHRDDIEPFLPGIARDFDAYCALMARHSTWGGEPELAMAAQHVLRRPLSVYSARLGDAIARASAAATAAAASAAPGDDDDAAGGLPPPVVTYGEDFLSDSTAPHVVRLLWSGNHYETLVDEHRARRLRLKGGAAGGDGNGGGNSDSRSRL